MMRCSATVIAAVALLSVALGQQVPPAATSAADQAIAAARKVYDEQGPRPALPEFESLLARFEQANDRHSVAITLGFIANCYRRLNDFPKALDFAQRGLSIKQQLRDVVEQGRSYNQLGLIYWQMADYPKAVASLNHAIEIGRQAGDRVLQGSALNNLGLVEDEQGDYRQSSADYQQALELDRAAGFERGESDVLGNLGGVKMLLGRYHEALDYYGQSLKLDEAEGLLPAQSADLGNLALCYSALGRTDDALATFDRALRIAAQAGVERDQADWERGKGEVLLRAGQYDTALAQYDKAQQVYERGGLKRELVDLLNDTGNLRLLLGDTASAERDFRRALQLAHSIGNPHGVIVNLLSLAELERRRARPSHALSDAGAALGMARKAGDLTNQNASLIALALVQQDRGNFDAAIESARDAVDLAQQMQNPPEEAQARYMEAEVLRAQRQWNPALEQYGAAAAVEKAFADPELHWRLDFGRGQALEAQGRTADAVDAYESAVSTLEKVRAGLVEERFRAGYLQDRYQVYVALVELLLRLHRASEAFSYSERLRARSYLDQLGPSVPPAGGERERELEERIRQLRHAMQDEWSQPPAQRRQRAPEAFSAELAEAERQYSELLDRNVTAPGRAAAVPGASAVQRELPARSALLEYVVGSRQLDILVITPSAVHATSIPVPRRQLESRIELLRYFISHPGDDEWRLPAAGLRHILIDPVEHPGWLHGTRELFLAADGVLNYVPFAALPRTGDAAGRYLVDDYVLAYLPTAAALHPSNGDEPPGEESALALAPSNAHLRWSGREARNVAALFAGRSRLLAGSLASESSFKRLVGNYQVLHLATHAYLNRYAPLLSALQLEPGAGEDGRLEVHEILQLHLHADLVTLSACETGLGSGYFTAVPAGDEFVGMTRAFLSAGARSVVASLWAVNDRSTLNLMLRFYRHRKRTDSATALAEAQREMSKAATSYRHPYFWAPFTVTGN